MRGAMPWNGDGQFPRPTMQQPRNLLCWYLVTRRASHFNPILSCCCPLFCPPFFFCVDLQPMFLFLLYRDYEKRGTERKKTNRFSLPKIFVFCIASVLLQDSV